MRRSISAAGGRVIHQIEPPSDIALPQIPELVQLRFNLFPRPMKWLYLDVIGTDQLFIRHQVSAVFTQRKSSKRADLSWVGCLFNSRLFDCRCRFRIFVEDKYIQFFQKRRVAVTEPHLQFVCIVEVLVDGPRWRGPHVVLLVIDPVAIDIRIPGSVDTKIYQRRVMPRRFSPLTRFQDTDGNCDGISQSVTEPGLGMCNPGFAAAVCRRRKICQTLNLGIDVVFLNDHWRDQVWRLACHAGAIDKPK